MNDLTGHTSNSPVPAGKIDPGNLAYGLTAGVVTACAFGVGGYFLVKDDLGAMGSVLFLSLPFVTGFATALIARRWNILVASLILGFLITTVILLATGQEGWVCVLMSAPLIVVGLAVGAALGVLAKYLIEKSRQRRLLNLMLLLVLPPFLMGADQLEKPSRRQARAETFTSVLVVDSPPQKVWDAIKTMEHVSANKGFLMRIGLPVPVSCSVDKEELGGTRTCYFAQGYIQERITEWDPPRSMKLEVTSWDIPGRPWLGFQDASYHFQEESGQTVMTRTSTIVSRLRPGFYWRPLEQIGVTTEHEYLFEAVRRRLGVN
jgi:hypothetical protein